MPDELQVRLHDPARHDLGLIAEFEIRLVVTDRPQLPREHDRLTVKSADAVRKPGVDHARAEPVLRSVGNESSEYDAAVDIGIDLIAIRRAERRAGEHRNSALRVAARQPVELLIDDTVDAVIASVLERLARAGRICEQQAVVVELLVVEQPDMPPRTNLKRGGKAGIVLAYVALELRLANEEGRIVARKLRPERLRICSLPENPAPDGSPLRTANNIVTLSTGWIWRRAPGVDSG